MNIAAQPWADKVTQRRISRHRDHNLLAIGEHELNGETWTSFVCDCKWAGLLRKDQIKVTD